MTYSPNYADMYTSVAGYVARILQGEFPGDLPVQQPTKFDLIIKLSTVDALGINIPPEIMIQATEFIE